MRVFVITVLLALSVQLSWAVQTEALDGLVKNSHLSCKLARDIRRRDAEQSKSAFQFYLENKAALLAADGDYLVDGLTAGKVKGFCSRIERDFQRQDALLIYDKAVGACQASYAALNKGDTKKAKQDYARFKSFLDLATNTSSEAVELGHGSLQWRKCERLEQDLTEFTSGKVKQLRDRLEQSYARCLPIWSDMSTQRPTNLTVQQLGSRLSKMKGELSAVRVGVKKLKTPSLNATIQEFQTCINQVEIGLPGEYTRHRISALTQQLQRCQSDTVTEGFRAEAVTVLADQQGAALSLSEEQVSQISLAEVALNNCINREQESPIDPLQLDLEIEQESLDDDIVQQMLNEEASATLGAVVKKPAKNTNKDHWKMLSEERIELGR